MPHKDKEVRRKYSREYYLAHRERCNAATRKSYQKHRQKRIEANRLRRELARLEALTYYGNGKLACVRCGFYIDVRALTIDHIKGGGKQAERERKGTQIAQWLRKRGFPEGYQTLCMNCQFIKKMENKEQCGSQ